MTQPSRYRGLPVSEGTAAGQLYPGDTPAGTLPATPEQVAEAFAAVARERSVLAQQLREGGRGEEALEEFRQAGRAGGGADSLFNEGVCLERLGRAGEAREAYRRAIAARPDYAQAYNNLGNLLAESGDRLGAIAAYEGFLRSWRGDTAARRAVEEEVQKLR